MAFDKEITEGGVEITIRVSDLEFEYIKYAGAKGYDWDFGIQYSTGKHHFSPERLITRLVYEEMQFLMSCSGAVEKFRLQMLLDGKDPDRDLSETNPELFERGGGIVKERKVPHFKPRFPALLTYRNKFWPLQ